MRVAGWLVAGVLSAGLLGAATRSGLAQMKDYKDPYSAAETGKAMAPAKAVDAMLSMFEYQLTGVAKAMPADKYDFAPKPETFVAGSPAKFATVSSFSQELAHLIGGNYYFFSKATGDAMPAEAKAVHGLKTKDELLAALKQSFVYAHAQVAKLTPENAFLGIEGADGMHTPITLETFAVAHGNDHYGQMVEYLRMNGVVPPGSK